MTRFIEWLRSKKIGATVHIRDYITHALPSIGVMGVSATLSARVLRKNGSVEDLGVISTHAVTDAFVNALVDTLQAAVASFSTFKYHDSGTGTTAESAADTALVTPCGEARDIGTQTEGATTNIYRSVATHTYASAFTITEHGLFNALLNGTLMDRSVFSGIGVSNGDKIEFTYELTCVAGG